MWHDITPDRQRNIGIDGYQVAAYAFGTGAEVVLCLNGGAGLPCDYPREAHSCLEYRGSRGVALHHKGSTKRQLKGNTAADLPAIKVPCLMATSQHDKLTPACAVRMKSGLPPAGRHVFPNSGRMPFYEELQAYYPASLDFLARQRQGTGV